MGWRFCSLKTFPTLQREDFDCGDEEINNYAIIRNRVFVEKLICRVRRCEIVDLICRLLRATHPTTLRLSQGLETGFLPQYSIPTLNLPKSPVSLIPAQKPETGFLWKN